MTPRITPTVEYFSLLQPLIDYAKKVAGMGLEKNLVNLVEMRASQINGCAVCLHMHIEDALSSGERPNRVYMLDAWRESSLYSEASE